MVRPKNHEQLCNLTVKRCYQLDMITGNPTSL